MQPPDNRADGLKAFLRFRLGGLEFGLDYAKVQELRVLNRLQPAPDGAGLVMPIVDMRVAFTRQPTGQASASAQFSDVIVLKLADGAMGMVVDAVNDVVQLAPGQISAIPGVGPEVSYLCGMSQLDGRRLILIDIEQLMAVRKADAALPA